MTGRDGYGDPIPPGHGETGETFDFFPFERSGPAWTAAPPRTGVQEQLPAEQFGVPLCGRCHYYHLPEETCRR